MATYTLHNAHIQITSPVRSFLDFVSWNLLDRFPNRESAINFQLECELLSYNTFFTKNHMVSDWRQLPGSSGMLLSTGAWIQDNNLYWSSPRANIHFRQIEQNHFLIRAHYQERPDHSIRRMLWHQKVYLYNNYQVILRLLVYAPLFWLFEQQNGYFVIHGAGISGNGRNIILAGLNGIGKTSLALAFAANGYQFLGDNYLLHDANTIYAFPESIRISEKAARTFGLPVIPDVHLYGKRIVRANTLNLLADMRPNIFLIVVRGPVGRIDPISLEDALNLTLAQGDYLSEYAEHTFMGLNAFASYSSHGHNGIRISKKLEATRSLLSKCKLGLLQIGENEPATQTIQRIERF